MTEDSLVTVASFPLAVDAHLAKSRLEADGIDCWIQDEHTIGLDFQMWSAIGGVKVQVRDRDEQRAMSILEPKTKGSRKPSVLTKEGCPKCGSTVTANATYAGRTGIMRIFLWLFCLVGMLLPPPGSWRRRRCRKCQNVWKV